MVDASLVVAFDAESRTNESISLELHRGFVGLRTGIPFRVYPQVEARLVCEFGTISLGQQRYSEKQTGMQLSSHSIGMRFLKSCKPTTQISRKYDEPCRQLLRN